VDTAALLVLVVGRKARLVVLVVLVVVDMVKAVAVNIVADRVAVQVEVGRAGGSVQPVVQDRAGHLAARRTDTAGS